MLLTLGGHGREIAGPKAAAEKGCEIGGLESLGGVPAQGGWRLCAVSRVPKGRTTGGAKKTSRDPTRLMTPKGVCGYLRELV